MLNSIPYVNRVYDMFDAKWSDWEKRFAWYPRRIPVIEHRSKDIGNITVNHMSELGHRWVWLRHYYYRHRMDVLGMTVTGGIVYQDDYAFDLFDIVRKAQ